MNFWKKLFGKNNNSTEVIVAVVMENEMKVFDSIEHASRYFTDRNMTSALESIKKLKNRTERNVKAIKITEDFEIIEYPSLQKLKEDQSKNKIKVLSAFSQNQVRITLHQPPPNQLTAGDLWKMTLENTTGSPIEIYFEGYGDEQSKGRIVDGRSLVFTLPPGRSNYNYENFKTGNVNWKNSNYEEFIVRTGKVPAGSYTTCVTAYSSDGNVVGMEKCITQIISRGFEGEIILIAPGDGKNIDLSTPITFSWTPLFWGMEHIGGVNRGGTYILSIVEMKGGQSPEEAMQKNKVFFEEKNIRTTSFQYPSSAPKFIEGKKYVWQVLSKSSTINENDFFRIEGIISKPGVIQTVEGEITLMTPSDGENIDPSTPISFSWKAVNFLEQQERISRIKIVEIIGDQSPEVAILRNKAFFEKEDIRTTSFQYPSSAPKFVERKRYTWQVLSEGVVSEVYSFTSLLRTKVVPIPPPAVRKDKNKKSQKAEQQKIEQVEMDRNEQLKQQQIEMKKEQEENEHSPNKLKKENKNKKSQKAEQQKIEQAEMDRKEQQKQRN